MLTHKLAQAMRKASYSIFPSCAALPRGFFVGRKLERQKKLDLSFTTTFAGCSRQELMSTKHHVPSGI